jgi:hypothetical protein
MVTFMSEDMLQKLRAIAACRECSLEEALKIAIEHTLASQNEADNLRGVTSRSVEIPDDLRRALDESA